MPLPYPTPSPTHGPIAVGWERTSGGLLPSQQVVAGFVCDPHRVAIEADPGRTIAHRIGANELPGAQAKKPVCLRITA